MGIISQMWSKGTDKETTASEYQNTIRQTAEMVSDQKARALTDKYGLEILNVTWEDTGRYKGSSVGPNISDVTIQVQDLDPETAEYKLTCMPVIRYPNFADLSADVKMDEFFVLVGNEKGSETRRVNLSQYLGDLRAYLFSPDSWEGKEVSLLNPKGDSHVLVSAQACFLPIPKEGVAEFNPVLFNYQSQDKDPAVLAIVATQEGTSATIIDNVRDGFEAGGTWGQRLFFNQNGERASLTGQRISDYRAHREKEAKSSGEEVEPERSGLNMALMIQVPLKQKNPANYSDDLDICYACNAESPVCRELCESDVEEAVVGHGKVEGPFTEIDHLEIQRDTRFPIRVTVQFYKATSNGVVEERDIDEIATQIKRVYEDADYVGSLVVEGETRRPTEHVGEKAEPPDWWEVFWKRHRGNTGMSQEETVEMLKKLLGNSWHEASMEVAESAVRNQTE